MKKFLTLITCVAALALSSSAQMQLTVADGTQESSWFPLPSSYFERVGSRVQVLYPAEFLTDMIGADITSMKFYVTKDHGMHFSGGKHRISLASTNLTFLGNTFIENGLQVVCKAWEGPEEGTYEIEMVFDEPFTYTGGGLIYDWVLLEEGYQYNYITTFDGIDYEQEKQYYYNSIFMPYSENPEYMKPIYMNMMHFIPKTTFTYERVHVTAHQLDFGELLPNGQREMKFKVKNINDTPITPTISGITVPFSTNYSPTSLAPGASTEITITMNPPLIGQYKNVITVDCETQSYEVELKGWAKPKIEFTVCDGNDTDFRSPLDQRFADTKGTYGQAIYPAEILTGAVGNSISGVRFYLVDKTALHGPTLEFSMGTTEQKEFGDPVNNLTKRCSMVYPDSLLTMQFNFDEPFTYTGGNLAIQILVQKAKGYAVGYYYGKRQATNTAYSHMCLRNTTLYDTELIAFLPKMTLICLSDMKPRQGDVNLDGDVDVKDVTMLINGILGSTKIDDEYADVNGDQNVDVQDVTALITIILSD